MKSLISLNKYVLGVLIIIFFNASSISQVGIGTTTPQTTLEITGKPADNTVLDGVIAPRLTGDQLSAKTYTAAETAAIVYVTAADGTPSGQTVNVTKVGYYYFDSTVWIALIPAEDGDFYKVGTTTAPSLITDDVFRTGNVAIGKTTASYPLDIKDLSSTRAVNISTTANTAGIIYGVYVNNQNTNTGTDKRYGIFNRVRVPSGQLNQAYGTYNELTGAGGTGNQFGTYNRMIGNEDRKITGTHSWLSGAGDGEHIGVVNNMFGTGLGVHTGTQNQMRGTGVVRGVYNSFSNASGNGTNRGVHNSLTNSGTGLQQGMYTSITGSGTGEHIGVSNFINSSGGGPLSGTINTFGVLATGIGVHRGTYNNISGGGILYGIDNNVDGTLSGQTAYGTYNDVNSNNGTNYAGWFDAHGTGATYYAAVFNRGHVVANESGGDFDFRIEGQTDTNLFFADANTNNVGIGTNIPSEKLEVNGKIKAVDINFSGIPSYASDAAANADGGLASGDVYRIGQDLRIKL